MNDIYSVIKDDKNKTTYLIIRDTKFKNDDFEKEKNENLTIVFNFEDLSKKLTPSYASGIISKFHPNSLKIENSLVESSGDNFLNETEIEQFEVLYISDECYSMSPHLKDLFPVKAKTLILKKIKINSKKQLNNFLTFILSTNCENLFLEDIFIELLIKKDENDENFNVLDEYIGFENGKFYIKSDGVKKTLELKTLKLIDCPLFAITDDTFKEIKKYKEIKIDIDENSLLDPSIITRFRIDDGLSDFCFDLDSYKLNEEEKDDDIENIEYIINKIADDENNEYNKLIFKNFDITKYEYITGENLTFIKEENWILNNEEKKKCKKFEEKDDVISKKIDENKNKLSKVKSLVFDNCSNYFIQLILKFINSSKNDLELLKLKKCGKEHFHIENIFSLNINNLILFDTPLIVVSNPKDKKSKEDNLSNYKGEFGKIDNFTIKIASLEHYCKENNLDYYNTLEIIVELIKKKGYFTNLIFEMNALPIIMTFLIAKKYCEKDTIPTYFEFTQLDKDTLESKNEREKKQKIKEAAIEGVKKRSKLINETFNILGEEKKEIKLRKNYIKNQLENYDILTQYFVNEKGKELKIDFGSDVFNLDKDYRQFFILNNIETIIFENCLFTNYVNTKLGKDEQKLIKETLLNLCEQSNKHFKFDIKTINEVIFKNKGVEDLTYLFRYLSLDIENKDLSGEIIEYLKNVKVFFDNLKNTFEYLRKNIGEITIIINSVKERKEFYCLMQVLMYVERESYKNYSYKYHGRSDSINLPNKEELKKRIQDYFLKEQNEDEIEILSVYNYYYTSDDEKGHFGEIGNEEKIKICEFGENKFKFKFNIEFNYKDPWKFIME